MVQNTLLLRFNSMTLSAFDDDSVLLETIVTILSATDGRCDLRETSKSISSNWTYGWSHFSSSIITNFLQVLFSDRLYWLFLKNIGQVMWLFCWPGNLCRFACCKIRTWCLGRGKARISGASDAHPQLRKSWNS